MAFICDKFAENCQKEINSDKIWAHLGTMYNLEALDDSESMPFPNSERDFTLPESEFGPLLAKREEDKKVTQKGRETPKSLKEIRKDEKPPSRNSKEVQRRDSKDSKDRTPANAKKEIKKESEKSKSKGKSHNSTPREDKSKTKSDDTPKLTKRPTRGSSKADDSSSSGKSSPITVTPPVTKRRRI